jgi:acetyl esterase
MAVDPELANLLVMIEAMEPIDLTAPDAAVTLRTAFDRMNLLLGSGPASVASEDRVVSTPDAEVPVRIFRPDGVERPPVLVYFHGGGFSIGNIATFDRECRIVAAEVGCAVVSVEYRLAPEHPFPAAPDDCFAALRWVAAEAEALGFDGARIAVGGDSAGGNLAAVTAQRALHEDGPQLTYQVLIYPVVDLASTMEEHRYPSLLENAEGYYLDAVTMEAFQSWYVPDPADRTNPLASPILAPSLAGLPPALVLTCEYDPLRDEGEAYAKALADVGVDVTLTRYDGGIHGVFSMSQITLIGRRCMDEVVAGLRAAFG